jgi:hypothetical protein
MLTRHQLTGGDVAGVTPVPFCGTDQLVGLRVVAETDMAEQMVMVPSEANSTW